MDNNSLIGSIFMGWIRHGLSAGGGTLVASGIISSSAEQQAIGAIMVLVPIVLSGYQKWSAQQKTNAAILAAAKAKGITG